MAALMSEARTLMTGDTHRHVTNLVALRHDARRTLPAQVEMIVTIMAKAQPLRLAQGVLALRPAAAAVAHLAGRLFLPVAPTTMAAPVPLAETIVIATITGPLRCREALSLRVVDRGPLLPLLHHGRF